MPLGNPKGSEPVHFTSDTTGDGVTERLFTLGDISGVLWLPQAATGTRPLVLLGHGGGPQHKKAPGLMARARSYVTVAGFAAAAIDAPGHGDRPRTEHGQQLMTGLRERLAADDQKAAAVAWYNAELAKLVVPEWQATLTALAELDEIGPGGAVGYWGMSMGCGIGVPLVAAEPRIRAAVLGLLHHLWLTDAAARISVPVEFVLQWDDPLVCRESGLALFDAFGSAEKTLHANPGGHGDVPAFEIDSSLRFFQRHLRQAG